MARLKMETELLTVEQLGAILRKSPASVRADASRNPSALPPICRLPGNHRLLWRSEDVFAWVAKHVERNPADNSGRVTSPVSEQPRKRGRPRKTLSSREQQA